MTTKVHNVTWSAVSRPTGMSQADPRGHRYEHAGDKTDTRGLGAGMLVAVDDAAYLAVLQAPFAGCRAVLSCMAERTQGHWDEIKARSLRNSRYRVVHYLLSLATNETMDAATIELPAAKSLIAAKLAVTPETLSRILRLHQDEALIKCKAIDCISRIWPRCENN